MPQDIRIQKNDASMQSQAPQKVGLDVAEDLRSVQAEQHDPSQIMRALDGIGQFFEEQGQKNLAKQKFADTAQGTADAQRDSVDMTKLQQSEAYKNAVNTASGERQALQWYNQKKIELENLQRQDPNMDFEAWRKSAVADLYGNGAGDPHQIASMNQMAGQLDSALRSQFDGQQAKMLHDQAEKEYTGKNLALLDASSNVTSKDIDAMVNSGKALGLTDQESKTAAGKAIAAKIESGHPELYEAVKGADSALHLDGEVGVHLQESYRIGQARKKEQDEQANLVHGTELFQTMTTATRAAAAGGFGMTQANALKDKLPDHVIVGLLDHSMSVNEENAKKANTQAEAVAAESQRVHWLTSNESIAPTLGMSGPDGKPQTPELYQQTYDRMSQNAYWNLRNAIQSNDPNAVADAVKQQAGTMDIGVRHGLVPTALKYNLERATTSNPQDFIANAQVYTHLKSAGLGGYLTGTMPQDVRAKYDYFNELTTQGGGMSAQQAIQTIDNAKVEPTKAKEIINGAHKEIDTAIATARNGDKGFGWFSPFSSDDGYGSQFVRKQIEAYATADVMATGSSAGPAIARATQRFQADYDVIGGIPINKSKAQISDDFASHFKDYEKEVIVPKLAEHYGEDAKSMVFTIAPAQTPGRFYVVPTNVGTAAPMQDPKTGQFITFTQGDMIAQTTKAKQITAQKDAATRARDADLADQGVPATPVL